MIDPEELAEYEAWKHAKLVGQVDLSITAFNTEQQAVALAYDAGVRAAAKVANEAHEGGGGQKWVDLVLSESPYRSPGTKGELSKRITS